MRLVFKGGLIYISKKEMVKSISLEGLLRATSVFCSITQHPGKPDRPLGVQYAKSRWGLAGQSGLDLSSFCAHLSFLSLSLSLSTPYNIIYAFYSSRKLDKKEIRRRFAVVQTGLTGGIKRVFHARTKENIRDGISSFGLDSM